MRGIYRGRDETVDETQFFFHWDYLNETMKRVSPGRADQVGFYMIAVTRPDLAPDVALAVDKAFKNSLAETLTETEKAFNQGFIAMSGAIVTAIQMVSFVVILIIMAVVANTMAMTTRERIGDYAIMKTLGFGGTDIAVMVFGESLVISLTGCLDRDGPDLSGGQGLRPNPLDLLPHLHRLGRNPLARPCCRLPDRLLRGDHPGPPCDPRRHRRGARRIG